MAGKSSLHKPADSAYSVLSDEPRAGAPPDTLHWQNTQALLLTVSSSQNVRPHRQEHLSRRMSARVRSSSARSPCQHNRPKQSLHAQRVCIDIAPS